MSYSCRYCASSNITECYPTRDVFDQQWMIYTCHDCYAYFLTPTPTPLQLSQAYDTSYYGEGQRKFIPLVEKVIDFFRSRRAKKLFSLIPTHAKVLDLGCGNGQFLQYLSRFGDFELHGIEMAGGSADRAAQVNCILLKIGTLKQHDYPDHFFDAITLFHVFEHLDNPKETLRVISNIIKENGILVMSFPNISSWQSRCFKGKWLHLDPPRHLIFFAIKDFIYIMQDFGFQLLHKRYLSLEQNPFGWIQSILNVWCKKREVLFERLKGNTRYAPEYGRFNLLLQKLFFVTTMPIFICFELLESKLGKSATVELVFKKKVK